MQCLKYKTTKRVDLKHLEKFSVWVIGLTTDRSRGSVVTDGAGGWMQWMVLAYRRCCASRVVDVFGCSRPQEAGTRGGPPTIRRSKTTCQEAARRHCTFVGIARSISFAQEKRILDSVLLQPFSTDRAPHTRLPKTWGGTKRKSRGVLLGCATLRRRTSVVDGAWRCFGGLCALAKPRGRRKLEFRSSA